MLYEINNEYYIRRGRKYTKVNVIGSGENTTLKPDMNKTLEVSDKLKVKEVSFADIKRAKNSNLSESSSSERNYNR